MAFVVWLFVGSAVLAAVAFWLHGRLAGPTGRPGARSMAAFVLGWLATLSALMAGLFLLTALVGG